MNLPEKYNADKKDVVETKPLPSSNHQQDLEKAGNKRSAPDLPEANAKSPTKKQNTASSISSVSTNNKTEAAETIENLILNKNKDGNRVNTSSRPVLNKIPKLPPSKDTELLPREKGND